MEMNEKEKFKKRKKLYDSPFFEIVEMRIVDVVSASQTDDRYVDFGDLDDDDTGNG